MVFEGAHVFPQSFNITYGVLNMLLSFGTCFTNLRLLYVLARNETERRQLQQSNNRLHLHIILALMAVSGLTTFGPYGVSCFILSVWGCMPIDNERDFFCQGLGFVINLGCLFRSAHAM